MSSAVDLRSAASIHNVPAGKEVVKAKGHLPNPYRLKKDWAEIGLTNALGKVVAWVKVDKEDLKQLLFSRRWRSADCRHLAAIGCHWSKDRRRGSNERIGRIILNAGEGDRVIHSNGDGLDARRSNLVLIGRPRSY